MKSFETVGASDLKFRAIVGSSAIAFAIVFASFSFGLETQTGVVLGIVFGIIAAGVIGYFVTKKLY
ncbi:hypothetical protein ACFQE1_04470 [Halobium palmae]|uniref:Major facilitator superfamily (MFS) profile domain-containing protein n=1 Tax=Halobium palmae TaxID=1776492 RepID=A0ABD5RW93_9EURY